MSKNQRNNNVRSAIKLGGIIFVSAIFLFGLLAFFSICQKITYITMEMYMIFQRQEELSDVSHIIQQELRDSSDVIVRWYANMSTKGKIVTASAIFAIGMAGVIWLRGILWKFSNFRRRYKERYGINFWTALAYLPIYCFHVKDSKYATGNIPRYIYARRMKKSRKQSKKEK